MTHTYERDLSRRGFLGGLSAAAVAGAAGVTGLTAAPAGGAVRSMGSQRPGPPNIVLILLDDLGWGELGCYGQQVIETPTVDGLAAEGLRFNQAYVNTVCAPTRGSLMQGLHCGHGRVKSNADAVSGLRSEDVTVAEVLQQAGYTTGLVGKWGLGPDNGSNPSHPNSKGFDYFFGYINQRHAHDYWPTYLWRNSERLSYPENEGADVTYAPELITEEALGFIDRSQDEPFFLYLTYNTPHAPNEIPSDAPYSDEDWPQGERNHAAQITWTDGQIGRVLERLEELGLAEDTLVLITSDNGPHSEGANYAHVGSTLPHDPEFFDSNGPLRGTKRDLYEGGVRVPLVVRLPASLRDQSTLGAGALVRDPVAIWDFLPTFAEIAGTSAPPADGVSIVPYLLGQDEVERDYFYWEFHEGGFDQAVRWGKWKAIRLNQGPIALYDVRRDIAESTNVAAKHKGLVAKAEGLMADAVA
jgi:arylsulfatase A